MDDKILKNLIAIIENFDFQVMWNADFGKYCVLRHIVHYIDGEAMVNFRDFRAKHIDLYNCSMDDFIFFRKSQMTEILKHIKK